jgi:hypothetical protein
VPRFVANHLAHHSPLDEGRASEKQLGWAMGLAGRDPGYLFSAPSAASFAFRSAESWSVCGQGQSDRN